MIIYDEPPIDQFGANRSVSIEIPASAGDYLVTLTPASAGSVTALDKTRSGAGWSDGGPVDVVAGSFSIVGAGQHLISLTIDTVAACSVIVEVDP
jgi:hypothetical protein